MQRLTLIALLLSLDANASVKDDALLILEAHGLALSMTKQTGCAVAEIGQPTRHTKVSCMGPEFEAYTRRAWDVLEAAGYTVEEVGLGFVIKEAK